MNTLCTPPTFPARPVNGGPLDKARPKIGQWCYEPKYNGWRALVHVPTGSMFNRHGGRLTIEKEFAAALQILRETRVDCEWLDCEGLERRHQFGRGTLFVLDCIQPGSYRERRDWMERQLGLPMPGYEQNIRSETAYLVPAYSEQHAKLLWCDLQISNEQLGYREPENAFYEGVVAKRTDSAYPIQLRNPNADHPAWMKHRFI